MNKILVLFSGGIDSTVCLIKAIGEVGLKNVLALSIDYGQNNIKELDKAKEICDFYKVEHIIINLKDAFKYCNSSLIKSSNKKIPHISYEKQFLKLAPQDEVSTNVAFRNGVMISVSASIALSKKINKIYIGLHCEDEIKNHMYPDRSKKFINVMSLLVNSGTNNKVSLISPLIDMNKKEIVNLASKLKVPFEKTWTCYEDDKSPCGKCSACIERIKGFQDNNINDPLNYK